MRVASPARPCVLAAVAAGLLARSAGAMEFSDLQQLIERRQPHSIEELLPQLPADMRSRYVLMFRSRSLHGASYSRPRAVLFSQDARFVLSFNGDPQLAGFRDIETLQFSESSQSFELREIEFAPATGGAAVPVISEANPERCLKCHGRPARPVWDTHPAWPGAYGESFEAGLGAAERGGLQEFLKLQPDDPRYRVLLETRRFANLETFRPSARERYEGDDRLPPNGQLGEALGRLNFRAIVHQLESEPRYPAYRYALLGALTGDCGPLDAFFPGDRRHGIESGLARFADATGRANAVQARMKALRQRDTGDRTAAPAPSEVESLDRFRFIVEYGMGLSTGQWTTALEKGSYDFTWSPAALAEMSAYLQGRLAQADPDVAVLADLRAYSERDAYCSHLRQQSRLAIAALPAGPAPDAPSPGEGVPADRPGNDDARALLARCAGCHAAGVGPPLPFDREAELAASLRSGPFVHGTLLDEIRFRLGPRAGAARMPLGLNVGDADRAALLDYLEDLARRSGPR